MTVVLGFILLQTVKKSCYQAPREQVPQMSSEYGNPRTDSWIKITLCFLPLSRPAPLRFTFPSHLLCTNGREKNRILFQSYVVKVLKPIPCGLERLLSGEEHLFLRRTWVLSSVPMAVCNFISRESNALFWPLCAGAHECSQNSHMHKKK